MGSCNQQISAAVTRVANGSGGSSVQSEADGVSVRGSALPGSRIVFGLGGLVFCLHLMGSLFFPAHVAVSCLGIGGCYVVAAVAAFFEGRSTDGMMRNRWVLVAVGLGLGVFGLGMTLYRECWPEGPAPAAGMDDVVLLLQGLPFLMAVCLSHRETGLTLGVLNVAQMALLAFLASFALLFASPAYLPVANDSALVWMTAANLLVAVLASVRCLGHQEGEESGFFRVVTAFLWSNASMTGLVNWYFLGRLQVSPGSPLLILADLPVLGLLVAMGWKVERMPRRHDDGKPTFAETASSMSIPVCSLLLAAAIVPGHLHFGLAGVAMAFLLYGVRSTVVLRKSLAAQQELMLTNRSMADQAFSDALTGIANRRHFDLTLEREWKRAQRSRRPLALLMIDVDHFKQLNDQHGHPGGDTCLRQIADLIRSGLGREADFAARYGGEEFAVLLVDTGIEGARIVGESLRRTIELQPCAMADEVSVSFTISVGIASEIPLVRESSMTLVAAADKALYRAKRRGRNRVEVHAWQMEELPAISDVEVDGSDLLLDADG